MLTSLLPWLRRHAPFKTYLLRGVSGTLGTSLIPFKKIHVVTFILPADLDVNFHRSFKHHLLPPSGCRALPGFGLGRGCGLGPLPSPLPGRLWESCLPPLTAPRLPFSRRQVSVILVVSEERWVDIHIVPELRLFPQYRLRAPWWAVTCSCALGVTG